MKNLALLLVVGACASVAVAQPAITGLSGGSSFDSYYGLVPGDVVGFRFTSDVDQYVTDLGVMCSTDGVIDSPHMVGLWDAGGSLLASVEVDGTGTILNGWYYEAIAPVALAAGERYTLGALYNSGDLDGYFSGPSLTLYNISNTVAVYPAVGGLGFVYPEFESAGNQGRIGPNMILTDIPAPGSLALLGLGGLALRRRR
jgi:uncharacterized protein (TIGR03382 family)